MLISDAVKRILQADLTSRFDNTHTERMNSLHFSCNITRPWQDPKRPSFAIASLQSLITCLAQKVSKPQWMSHTRPCAFPNPSQLSYNFICLSCKRDVYCARCCAMSGVLASWSCNTWVRELLLRATASAPPKTS